MQQSLSMKTYDCPLGSPVGSGIPELLRGFSFDGSGWMTYDADGGRVTSKLMGGNMKRITRLMIPMAVCGLLVAMTAARADEKKADPTGTWSWTITGRDGTPRKVTAKLK